MYEKAFTCCPTDTPVAARVPKISVEIKYFMVDHRMDQTCDQVNRSERVQPQATTASALNYMENAD
jgi:hypothetical protein